MILDLVSHCGAQSYLTPLLPSIPSLPRKQVENKLGESRLQTTSNNGS